MNYKNNNDNCARRTLILKVMLSVLLITQQAREHANTTMNLTVCEWTGLTKPGATCLSLDSERTSYPLTPLSTTWVPQSISFQFFPLPLCTHRCGLVFLALFCITCTSCLGNLCAFFPNFLFDIFYANFFSEFNVSNLIYSLTQTKPKWWKKLKYEQIQMTNKLCFINAFVWKYFS